MTAPTGDARRPCVDNPRDLVLAVLAATPRFTSDGVRVRVATWNAAAASNVVSALTDAGWLPTPEPKPTWRELPPPDQVQVVGSAQILAAVAGAFGLQVPVLTGTSRTRIAVHARQIAMYLCRTRLALSYPTIGRLFGRDHTTAMYAIRKIDGALEADLRLQIELHVCQQTLPDLPPVALALAAGAA